MRKFSWLKTTALVVGLVLGPTLAFGAFNLRQGPEFDAWFENSLDSIRALYFNRQNHIQILNSTQAVVGELTSKEYTINIADLGTAGSHYLVMPTTGIIYRVDATANGVLTTTNTVLRLFADNIGGAGVFRHLPDVSPEDDRVTAFSITMTTNQTPGIAFADDDIGQAVSLGEVIAVETDGGTASTVAGAIVIHIRMQ